MELRGFIVDTASLCLAKSKEFETKLCFLQQQVKTCGTFPQSSPSIEGLLERVPSWLSLTEECISNIEKSISYLKPSVPWHPDKKDMLEMFYLLGDSPWSFWLTYNMSSEIGDLIKNIEVRWRSGSLTQVVNPEVGSFVCCCDNKYVFRGIILSILTNTWVRVLNVDKGNVKVVKLDTCHDMIKEFSEPHANAIHCCLTKDDFDEKKWHPDLTELFQATLQDSRLTVSILDKLDEMPPKFVIELYAFNESIEVETNISHWISLRLLPALKMLDKEVEQEKLYTYLDDEVRDPFLCIADCGLNNSQTNDLNIPLDKIPENKLSVSILNGHHKDESLRDKPQNRLAHYISAEKINIPLTKGESVSPLPKEELSKTKLLFEAVVNVAESPNSSAKEDSNSSAFIPYIPKTEVAELCPPNSSAKEDSNSSAFIPHIPKTEVAELCPPNSSAKEDSNSSAFIPYIPKTEVAELCPPNSSAKEDSNSSAFIPHIPKTEVAELCPPNSSAKEDSNSSAFIPYIPKTEVAELCPPNSSAKEDSNSSAFIPHILKTEVAELCPPNSSAKEDSNSSAFIPYIPKTEVAELRPPNSSSIEVSNSSASLSFTPKTEVVDREPDDPLKCMAAIQDSVLPGDYLPTDDDRICSFFVKYGYCWKPTCRKEHTKVHPGKWTNDAEAIYNEVINKVSLPMINSTIRITVTRVMCAKTFYATLPDIYSEAEDGETITTLISDLNNTECLKSLKSMTLPPCFSQLLVAYSQKKKLWLRGSVSDLYDDNVFQVFFVDYGITEYVSLDKCREILPQFTHLPYQAVYCTMSGLYVENLQDEPGKLFLQKLIENKEIEVKVVDSCIQDNLMEVIPYLIPSGENVVEIMIKNGYCSVSQR